MPNLTFGKIWKFLFTKWGLFSAFQSLKLNPRRGCYSTHKQTDQTVPTPRGESTTKGISSSKKVARVVGVQTKGANVVKERESEGGGKPDKLKARECGKIYTCARMHA